MYAILEIGSNAIKALIYKENTVTAENLYQIKFLSNINIESEDYIRNNHYLFHNIESILKIFNSFNVKNIKCIATQVLRNANGQKICNYLLEKFQLKVEVLSGEMEAELSGYGVIFGINNADGLLIDLGGGSIELAFLQNNSVSMTASFPFGIKTLHGKPITDAQILDITSNKMLLISKIKHLYLTGGYFRAFAKKYLHSIKMPIKAIHNLEINTQEFINFIKKFKRPDSVLSSSIKIGENNAVNIIEALINKYEPISIIISNYSLKEGIRYQQLSKISKAENFILEKVKNITGNSDDIDKKSYIDLILPHIANAGNLFTNLVEIIVLYLRYSVNFDQTTAGYIVSQMILYSNINFTHKERIFIAIVNYTAHNASVCLSLKNIAKKFLDKEEFLDAYIIGLILFIHNTIDGFLLGKASFKLELIRGNILTVDKKLPQILFSKIKNTLKEIYSINKSIKMNQNQ